MAKLILKQHGYIDDTETTVQLFAHTYRDTCTNFEVVQFDGKRSEVDSHQLYLNNSLDDALDEFNKAVAKAEKAAKSAAAKSSKDKE